MLDERQAAAAEQLDGRSIAYFLIPLPEPLGLPGAVPFEFMDWESPTDQLLRATPGSESQVPQLERLTSLVAHARRGSTDPSAQTADLMALAQEVLPWAATGKPKRRSRAFRRKQRSRSDGPLASDLTIMEAAVSLPAELTDTSVSDAFDEALKCIRHIQNAYHLVRRSPLTLCRRETLPPMIPFAVGTFRHDAPPDLVDGLSAFLTNMNVHARADVLDAAEIDLFRVAVGRPEHAFATYLDSLREARLASGRRGDQRAAAILAGAAGESLLDVLLLHLLWEECAEPQAAADLFADPRRGLLARVSSDLAPRVGGSWDRTKDDEFGRWHDDCYMLRHRAVHSGYVPTPPEVDSAIEAVEGLVLKIGRSLRSSKRLGRYPRTALMVSSEAKLRAEGLWSAKMQRLTTSPDEPNWAKVFSSWTAVVDLHRAMAAGTALPPDPRRAHLLLVLATDGSRRWVLHDHDAGLACLASEPELAQTEPLAGGLEKVAAEYAESGVASAHSALMKGDDYHAQPTGPWVPAHQLVPEAAVMRDGSDPGLK
jgi:hypothetical protein